MKKILLPIMFVLMFAFAACGGNVDSEALVESASNVAEDVVDSVNDELSETTEEPAATEAPAPTAEPEPTDEPEPTPEPTEEPMPEPTDEPIEEPTEVPVEEDVHPVLAELPDDVVLRGAIIGIGFAGDLRDQEIVELGDTFEFLETPWNEDFPDYNISSGDVSLAAFVEKSDGLQIGVLVPNLSETEIGKEANDALLGTRLTVTAVGDANQPVKPDDFMEVALTDTSSSNLPYTVNFYRGEARELVATFTINNQ